MFTDNRTTYLKRGIMAEIAKLFFSGRLIEDIDRLPTRYIPRGATPHRCCVEKDREIVRQRAIGVLGFGLDDEDEVDTLTLSDFARRAMERDRPEEPILTFMNEGCRACVQVNYYVTEVCRNCVAKPCMVNCPKNAISADERKASIDPQKCVNCGICLKVCPYHAIVFVPVPCEESCPVGAIRKDEQGRELVDYDKCIHCGKCIRACPFGAVIEKSQLVEVMRGLTSPRPVAALVAPAIAGQFPGTVGNIAGALRMLGFSQVMEVAAGADTTADTEAHEIAERLAAGDPLMGTSCCPAYVEAVDKHAPAFAKYVSHARTPMAYSAAEARRRFPDAVTVFIGPCVAKRHEGLRNPDVDYVLTFEELGALFIGKGIDVAQCAEAAFDSAPASAAARNFPVTQGVAGAVREKLGGSLELKPVVINGFTRKSVQVLNIYASGKCPGNLVEVMSCEGGCMHGPGVVSNPAVAERKLAEYVRQSGTD